MQTPYKDRDVRRYLLGQMPEDEAAAVERAYFQDTEVLEQVWGVENELVDAYVAGDLPTADRAAFESHYLASPVHRQRVATARALRAAAGTRSVATLRPAVPGRADAWATWLAVAAVLLMAFAAWRLLGRGPRDAPSQAEQPLPVPTSTPLPATPLSASPPPPAPREQAEAVARGPAVASFALAPTLLRGNQATPVLTLQPGTEEVALRLEGGLPDDVTSGAMLAFTVTTVEGTRVVAGPVHASASPGTVGTVRLVADRLPTGDYILSLARADARDTALRQYFFRVLRPR